MTNRDAAILIFVLAALLAGLTAIALLQATVVLVSSAEADLAGRAFSLIPTLFLGWCAVQLVRRRTELAERLFPEPSVLTAPADRRDWQLLGVVLIALHVLVLSLPELAGWAVELLADIRNAGTAWQEATGQSAASFRRGISALVDPLVAVVILAQRNAVVARLFPEDAADPSES